MRWIPIGSIGCVHMHQGITIIEGWGNPSCIQNAMENIEETKQKPRKIS